MTVDLRIRLPKAVRSEKPVQTCRYCRRVHYWIIHAVTGLPLWPMVGTGGKGSGDKPRYESICLRCCKKIRPEFLRSKNRSKK